MYKGLIALVVATFAVSLAPRDQWTVAAQTPRTDDSIVTTHHQVTVDGKILRYTARAGSIPIRENETGDVHGNMFFVSYVVDRPAGQPRRPLTFLWNGGPGSSSSLVHLLGFGPRRVRTRASPVDNQGTWLDFTDLVFVDPIGTGYSRPTRQEYGPEFYQTQGDAESVAEFIRVYRNRFETWDSALFLAGESYGVTRAAGVADVLQRRGITVTGVVLIGLALPLGQFRNELRAALMVPTYSAAAFANKKLPEDLQKDLSSTLQQAETWATTDYAAALANVEAMSESQRQSIIAQLARFTGLPADVIDTKSLTIPMPLFTEQLLRDRSLVVGRYDSRMTGPLDATRKQYDPTKDPSLEHIIDDVEVVRYLRSELGFKSDLQYQGPFGGGYPPATAPRGDWMSVRWNRAPPEGGSAEGGREGGAASSRAAQSPSSEALRRAMSANSRLAVFAACGYYDLVCSYAGNVHLANQLEPDLQPRVTTKSYAGGHAIYTETAPQLEMKRDVAEFFRRALRQIPPR